MDFVLKPEDIAMELARIAKHPYVAGELVDQFISPEEDRASETAHEDDETPLPSGAMGPHPTERKKRELKARCRLAGQPTKGSRRFFFFSVTIVVWISHFTSRPPSSGASRGAWC